MWKLKLQGKDRWVFLLTVGVILCILAFPAGSKSSRMALPASECGGGGKCLYGSRAGCGRL